MPSGEPIRLPADGTEGALWAALFDVAEIVPAFDLLAPDGLGGGADLTTVRPLRSVQVAGGTQALRRTAFAPVIVGDREGELPRPDLVGALVIKARAAVVDRGGDGKDPRHHLADLAHPYARVSDPRALAAVATHKDRQQLGAAEPDWIAVGDAELVANGRAARAIILGGS
jgi:hypothetical protein